MSERILASVEKIKRVLPHPNADLLSIYLVKGWQVIDQKDRYKEGDLVAYFEIDSWMPTELAPFLSKGKEPREFNSIKGERLRTIKLRGELSQGLVLPLDSLTLFPKLWKEGADLTKTLGIQKWEKPIPTQLAGQMKGNFPAFLRKTDQERIQNIPEGVLQNYYDQGTHFQVTEKLDGSSCTFYHYENQWGVTSRNIDLKLDQEGNTFVDMFNTLQPNLDTLLTELENLGYPNFAVQGELIGGKIQGNQYKIEGYSFYVFDIFDITTQTYLNTSTVEALASICGLSHVPVIETAPLRYSTVDDFLKLAEGQSLLNNSNREGLVFKSSDRTISFKVISNSWLLTND